MHFERKPTDPDMIIEPLPGEPEILLVAAGPDYIMLPSELGGGRANVLKITKEEFCNHGTCTIYHLDYHVNGKQLFIAKADKFYWFQRSEKDST